MLLWLGSNFNDFTFDQIFGESNYLSRDKKVWEMREKAVNRAFVLQVSTIVMCLLSAIVHALTHIFKLNFSTVNTDEMHGKLSTAVSCYWCCDVINFFDTIEGSLNCLLHLLMPAATFSFFAFPFLCPHPTSFSLFYAGPSGIDHGTLVVVGYAERERRVKNVVSVDSLTSQQ